MNIKKFNIDKIKEECKDIDPDIDYSKDDWEKEFIDDVDWDDISINKKLSEDFIEKYKNYVDWVYISWYQNLSEDFMEKHKDYVYWVYISLKQELSELFIEKYKDKIDFSWLFHNDNISNELILNNINLFIDQDVEYYSFKFNNKEFKDKWNKYKKLFGS